LREGATDVTKLTQHDVLPFADDPLFTTKRGSLNDIGKAHLAKLQDAGRLEESIRRPPKHTTDMESMISKVASLELQLSRSRRSRAANEACKRRRSQHVPDEERQPPAPTFGTFNWLMDERNRKYCELYTMLSADMFALFVEQLECFRYVFVLDSLVTSAANRLPLHEQTIRTVSWFLGTSSRHCRLEDLLPCSLFCVVGYVQG
jgi:hypothetical protein